MTKINDLKRYMMQQNIDICVIKHAENICLFTGYWPRNGVAYLVVGLNTEPLLIVPEVEFGDTKKSCIKDVKTYPFVRIKDGNPYDHIKKLMQDYKKTKEIRCNGTIAMDNGFEVIGVPICSGEIRTVGKESEEVVKEAFETTSLTSVREAIINIRAIKDKEDIKKLEIVNHVGRATLTYFKDIVEPGMTEIEIASKVEAFFATKAAGYKGCQYGKAWAQVSSGAKTADEGWFVGLISEARKIKDGDMVMLEMGAVIDGYWCDLTEMEVAGSASKKQLEVMTIVKEAQMKAIEMMKPGVKASEAYETAMAHIRSSGYEAYYTHGLGHGVGFMYHEAIPALGPGSSGVLEEGMVMSCEPGVYLEGDFGVRYEANVVIEADGARILGI